MKEVKKMNPMEKIWFVIGLGFILSSLIYSVGYIDHYYGFEISCFIHNRDCSWSEMNEVNNGEKIVINTELGTYVKDVTDSNDGVRIVFAKGGVWRYQLEEFIEELKVKGYVKR